MSEIDYERALASAKNELEELMSFQQSVETRIITLKQVIANLMALRGEGVPPDLIGPGLTEACRSVLRASLSDMAPLEIRSALQSAGYDLTKYSNPLATIHSVLKRLVESGDAETINRAGKTSYKWRLRPVPPPPPTSMGLEAPVPFAPRVDDFFKPKR